MKHAFNKETNSFHSVLVNSKIVSETQMQLVRDIQAYYAALENNVVRTIFTRKELKSAHAILRNRRASPYFICKNVACKTKDHKYNVAVLRVASAKSASNVTTNDDAKSETKSAKKRTRTKSANVAKSEISVIEEQHEERIDDHDDDNIEDVYIDSMR